VRGWRQQTVRRRDGLRAFGFSLRAKRPGHSCGLLAVFGADSASGGPVFLSSSRGSSPSATPWRRTAARSFVFRASPSDSNRVAPAAAGQRPAEVFRTRVSFFVQRADGRGSSGDGPAGLSCWRFLVAFFGPGRQRLVQLRSWRANAHRAARARRNITVLGGPAGNDARAVIRDRGNGQGVGRENRLSTRVPSSGKSHFRLKTTVGAARSAAHGPRRAPVAKQKKKNTKRALEDSHRDDPRATTRPKRKSARLFLLKVDSRSYRVVPH